MRITLTAAEVLLTYDLDHAPLANTAPLQLSLQAADTLRGLSKLHYHPTLAALS